MRGLPAQLPQQRHPGGKWCGLCRGHDLGRADRQERGQLRLRPTFDLILFTAPSRRRLRSRFPAGRYRPGGHANPSPHGKHIQRILGTALAPTDPVADALALARFR